MESKKCIYLPYEGKDEDLVRTAFVSFVNDYNHTQGWLAVSEIHSIEVLAEYPGLEFLKALISDSKIKINNFVFHRILKDSVPSDGNYLPLLAIHPTKDYLDILDNVVNIPLMIVVPFLVDDIRDWINNHRATNLLSSEVSEVDTLGSSIRETIIKEFGNIESPHKLKENSLIFKSEQVFKRLQNERVNYDPRSVKALLINELGYTEIEADIVYSICERIRSGKLNRFND
jgi:hypothetical protein